LKSPPLQFQSDRLSNSLDDAAEDLGHIGAEMDGQVVATACGHDVSLQNSCPAEGERRSMNRRQKLVYEFTTGVFTRIELPEPRDARLRKS
jgi:hypothetical protein